MDAPTTTVQEILRGLPDPDSCDGNTVEIRECLATVHEAWRGRLSTELERVRDSVAAYVDDHGDEMAPVYRAGASDQLDTLDRLASSWVEELSGLCRGLRGIEGTWAGIEAVHCEIGLMRETLLAIHHMKV